MEDSSCETRIALGSLGVFLGSSKFPKLDRSNTIHDPWSWIADRGIADPKGIQPFGVQPNEIAIAYLCNKYYISFQLTIFHCNINRKCDVKPLFKFTSTFELLPSTEGKGESFQCLLYGTFDETRLRVRAVLVTTAKLYAERLWVIIRGCLIK